MFVRDWMTRRVVTITPRTSVQSARRLLDLHGFRHLPVVEDDRLVGIVSDRDIRLPKLDPAMAAMDADVLTGRYRRIGSIMSTPVQVVSPEDTVLAAAELMNTRRIDALPVVVDGRLEGILSIRDCLRAWTSEGRLGVRDLISDHRLPLVPMPPGDDRPGRPADARAALVVSSDPAFRRQAAVEFATAGYRTVTCPGPRGGALCPGVRNQTDCCGRVPQGTELVILDASSRVLAPTYRRWLPDAEIRVRENPTTAVSA